MTGRAPLWLGLGLVAAGLVILGIGAVSGMPGPTGPGAGNPGGPGPMMGDEPTAGAVPFRNGCPNVKESLSPIVGEHEVDETLHKN